MGQCQSACQIGQDTRPPLQQSLAVEYNGERFIISEGINFEKQTTFSKVQQAARTFCQKNNISLFHIPLISRIIAYRHQFVFEEIWKRLSQTEREAFLEDLNSISHDLMDSFYYHFVVKKLQSKQEKQIPKEMQPPKVTREGQISNQQKIALSRYGHELLKSNKAIVLMCAGSSTRFDGGDKFLSQFKIGKRKSCILELLMLRLRRNASGNRDLPIIVNCNEGNSSRIQKYLKDKNHFGFNPTRFRFANTYSLAVFDHNGKYCLSQDMKLIKRPSGTAACAESLLSPGISKFLRNQGVQFLYFSGAQNLLQNPGDPLFLGIMLCERRRIGVKCVGQNYENEVLPRFWKGQKPVSLLGSEEVSRMAENMLLHLPVAMNSLVVQFDWLTEIVSDYNSNLFLAEKYHVLTKVERVHSIKMWKTQKRLCYSFEKDIRDLIGCVSDPILFRVSRSSEYAPIWTRDGQYCLQSAVSHFGERLRVELEVQLA